MARRDVTHAVDLVPFRISGPEITFSVRVPKDSMLRITAVRECWNCPFERIDYAVEVPQIAELKQHKVYAREISMMPEHVRCKPKAA